MTEKPRDWEYIRKWNGKQYEGGRFEVALVSHESHAYCIGVFKRKAKDDKAVIAAMSPWIASKVALAKKKYVTLAARSKS